MAQLSAAEAAVFPEGDEPERVAPDVWRIPLPLPLALRSVNVYLIDGGPGNRYLVDSGLGLPMDEAALRAGLAIAGVTLEDVTALVLTHAHPDHIGLSGRIQAASGGPVYILAGEEHQLLHVWTAPDGHMFTLIDQMFAANGLAEEQRMGASVAARTLRDLLRLPPPDALHLLHDDETLTLGEHTYHITWTPGHSDFHMVMLRDDGLFFAGDHVLPHITPNIGLYPEGRPNPLQDYFASLARVAPLPARLVLPGHGRPFADLAARAEALREHHIERGGFIRDILGKHPEGADAATVAAYLFEGRLRTPDDWRFAMAETLAHLEYQRAEQRLKRIQDGTLYRYTLVSKKPIRRK